MSKQSRILSYLKSGHSITQRQAIDFFQAYRLSGVIHRFKSKGHSISTELVTEGDSTFARYRMVL